jgi:exonuclease VII small subunit
MQKEPVTLATILTVLERLEKGQIALEKGQSALQGSVAALERGQSALEKGQSALEKGQSALQGSVSALEKGQSALEKGQSALEKGQSALEKGQSALEKGQSAILQRLDRVEVLLETESDRLDSTLEVLNEVVRHTAKIPIIENQITNIVSDNQVIKKAVTETNRNLHELDERVTILEVRA